jgi:hypothetical protein
VARPLAAGAALEEGDELAAAVMLRAFGADAPPALQAAHDRLRRLIRARLDAVEDPELRAAMEAHVDEVRTLLAD